MPNPDPTPFGYRDATGARHQVLVRQSPGRRLAGARHHRDRDPHRRRRGPRRRPRPSPATTRPTRPPGRAPAARGRTQRRGVNTQPPPSPGRHRHEARSPVTKTPRGIAADDRSTPRSGVALPDTAADGRHVLRRAGARAPPGAASRPAARASDGLVELAAGRESDGKLIITTRLARLAPGRTTSCPAAPPARNDWLAALLALADRHANRGEEVFIAPAGRSQPRGRQARRQSHPHAVGRRRPPRTAASPVGVPRRAPMPPPTGERRQRRGPLLLALG